MSYQQVFGGQTIYPAQLTFKNISLTADLTLEWPAEIATTNDVVAWIMRVSPTAGGFSIILDDATLASNGVSLLFYNAGAFTFTLKDSTGGTIASITAGTGWDIILRDNSTAAGSWLVIQRGAGTTEAQASQLAGAGLVALGGLLASSVLVTDRSSDFPITSTGRATLYDWTGGSGTATIDATSTLGTGWWAVVRNDGSGALTVTPASGQIDSAGSKVFDPNSAAFIFQDGVDLFTVGFGSGSGGTSFDYVSIDISSGSGGTYTLTGSQLNRIAYQFTGVLTGDVEVVIPSTVQEYWITNATTGAFDVAVRTAVQTPPGVSVGQGSSIIGYCNGTTFLQAAGTISTPVAVASGGTGATTASGARTNLAAAGTAVDNFFSANQTVVSVDGGGAVGPLITAFRNSASPVATDILGGYNIDGNNSAPAQKTYASIQATILDKTAATEDGTLDFLTIVAGALAKRGGFGQGFIVGAATDNGPGTITTTGAISVSTSGNCLVLSSSNSGGVQQIISTDATAVAGPGLLIVRNSASPAINDDIGYIDFLGKDSSGVGNAQYAFVQARILDPTAATISSAILIKTTLAGGVITPLTLGAGLQLGAPTGGDKGLGTLNATGLYINGVAVSGTGVPVRQTVLSGPVDSSGYSAFGGSTGSTTVTASGTLIVTAAGGWSGTSPADRTCSITNPSWTSLNGTSTTYYLAIDIDPVTGVGTAVSSTSAPGYRWGTTASIISGAFTFSIQTMVGKLGNGAAAVQTYRVYVGQATTNGANVVSSITWYALMGRFQSADNTITAATPITAAHNLGLAPQAIQFKLVCTTTDGGWAVGDEVGFTCMEGASQGNGITIGSDITSVFAIPAVNSIYLSNKSTGAVFAITLASWNCRMLATRGSW